MMTAAALTAPPTSIQILVGAAFALATLTAAAADASASDDDSSAALFSSDGYRIERYRRPTPDQPPAGRRIDTAGLVALIASASPVLVDVHAAMLRIETAEFGAAWLPAGPRRELPHSVWLPNIGKGRLSAELERYMADNLARLTDGNRDRALVFYCVVDCWMSWNAVKRAASLGYRNLYWYPEGSDGWAAAGLPLIQGEPVPIVVTAPDPGLRADSDPATPGETPRQPDGDPSVNIRERNSL